MLSAAALSGCIDRDPTGLRDYGEPPQFVTVGQYGSFTRLQPAGQPPLSDGFEVRQFQAVWPAAPGKVFISRGDDWWFQVDESVTSATVVSSKQDDLYPVGAAVQLGGWGMGLDDFWGAHEDGKLFRYDNGDWSVFDTNLGSSYDFRQLWGFSSSDIWAVGGDRIGTGAPRIAHYDGTWSFVSPSPNARLLRGVWGAASKDVWAVGEFATITHWNGTSWSDYMSSVDSTAFEDVHGSSANEVWAVGSTPGAPRAPLVVRWNGPSSGWQQVDFPFNAGHLHAVQVIGPNNVYVAGRGLYHWNGLDWTKINDPALKNPNTGNDLVLWDMRIGHGKLYAISPFGDLVIGDTTTSHTLTVTVEGSLLEDVAVTIANVETGAFYVECSDDDGVATFSVPAGNYLVHARNFFICNTNALTIWPNGDLFFAEESLARLTGRTNAIWLDGQSETLNTTNYLAAVADPLVLGAGETSLTLALQTSGATINCTLVDENGEPFELQANEMIYTITPFDPADEPNLPPRWPGLPDLPRGIGMAATPLEAGVNSSCSVDGMPAGDYVIETNNIETEDGDVVVYREAITVTEQEAQSGESVEVTMSPEPPRASTGYLFDVLGDASGPTDLGHLITYGWAADENGAATDEFIVTTAFRRAGTEGVSRVTLEIEHGTTTLVIPVQCVSTLSPASFECAIQGPAPAGVSVTGSANLLEGATSAKLTWHVVLPPDVNKLEFRIYSSNGNSPFPADRAPDSGHQPASKSGGSGNSFVIMGD